MDFLFKNQIYSNKQRLDQPKRVDKEPKINLLEEVCKIFKTKIKDEPCAK